MDVCNALFQMHANTSPGPEIFSPFFLQSYWEIIGKFVSNLCLAILKDNLDAACINNTFITLIPKIKNPTSVAHL